MISIQQHQNLDLNYNFHPLICQLNIDLINQNPFNPLLFIKSWATKKLKQQFYLDQDDQEQHDQQNLHQSQIPKIDQKLNMILRKSKYQRKNKHKERYIKRRNAICFHIQQNSPQRTQIPKSQQAISRIMISFKNDIFFKNLPWQQINAFVQKGIIFQTQQQNAIIKQIGQPLNQFFIIISGQVLRKNQANQTNKVFYTGQSFCHQSFLSSLQSTYYYECPQIKTQIFTISGSFINQAIKMYNHERVQFYKKAIINKQQFNYLDDEERDKLINCFKQKKQIMQGEFIFKGGDPENAQKSYKKIYLVLKGQLSKCKKNLSGDLQNFKTLRPGDFFGQESLLFGGQLQYSVLCVQDNSQIAYIQKALFEKVIDSYEKLIKRSKLQVKYNS